MSAVCEDPLPVLHRHLWTLVDFTSRFVIRCFISTFLQLGVFVDIMIVIIGIVCDTSMISFISLLLRSCQFLLLDFNCTIIRLWYQICVLQFPFVFLSIHACYTADSYVALARFFDNAVRRPLIMTNFVGWLFCPTCFTWSSKVWWAFDKLVLRCCVGHVDSDDLSFEFGKFL